MSRAVKIEKVAEKSIENYGESQNNTWNSSEYDVPPEVFDGYDAD